MNLPTLGVSVLKDVDTKFLNEQLLDEKGRIILRPADYYKQFEMDTLRIWCNRVARYQIVTQELVDFCKAQFSPMDIALEVAAGMGDLGHHLGIKMTDSAMQTRPEVRERYAEMQQPIIDPPEAVERIDAEAAVRKYTPDIVFASWLTQKWLPGDSHGSILGTNEQNIILGCTRYIHIGNTNSHGDKRALKMKHETLYFPWLISRAIDQAKNVIYIW